MSSVQHLRRAGFGGLSALVCASTALIMTGAGPASAAWTPGAGQIGIVDTNTTTVGTQGATSLKAGTSAQSVADVEMLVPNTCANTDTISLDLRDSTADPNLNVDAAHRLAFSAASVSVDPQPYTAASMIGPTSAGTVLTPDTAAGAPTIAPTFGASPTLGSSASGHGANDEATLTNSATCAGTAGDLWLVKVTGIKVDVGASVAAGPVQVVPSAKNAGTTAVALFGAGAYTVPGFVLPASIAVADPSSITADGSTQAIGDITVSELTPAAFAPAGTTYTVHITGATVKNDATNKVTATVTTTANGESIAAADVTTTANSVSFKLTQADTASSNVNLTSVKLHGVLLAASTSAPITYTLDSSAGPVHTALTTPVFPANQTDIVAPKISATGTSLVTGVRIGGSNRYATAAQVALQNKALGLTDGKTVVLASGEAFPDSLSSGFLSQRLAGASILLTKANSLPTATSSVLTQLGTTKVYIVGGNAAVSPDVQADVQSILGTGTIVRLGGQNRYDTNKVVNDAAANIGIAPIGKTTVTFGQASKTTALLATGEDFADALAFGPATDGNGTGAIPLILTRSDTLTQQAKDELSSFGIKQVIIGGGTGAVSSSIESDLGTMGIAVKRLAGANRYETATKVADFEIAPATPASAAADGGLGFDPSPSTGDNQAAGLATGQAYADALAGGPLAANGRSPILLTTSDVLQPLTQAWLAAHKADYNLVTAFGLQAAVSDAALNAAQAAIL